MKVTDHIHHAQNGSIATFTVVGELALTQGDKLEAAARRVLPDCEQVAVDLSMVTFMDSSGLGALIAINQAAAEQGTTLVLQSPPASVMRIMDMTATTSVFTIHPSGVPAVG